MNLKIKYRESFRPFAPAVLAERVSGYFELDRPSPYMLLVAPVAGRFADADNTRTAAVVWDREAQSAALDYTGGHARRLFGPNSDLYTVKPIRGFTNCSSISRR